MVHTGGIEKIYRHATPFPGAPPSFSNAFKTFRVFTHLNTLPYFNFSHLKFFHLHTLTHFLFFSFYKKLKDIISPRGTKKKTLCW